ncbi:MAG: LacI family DNA-binding transcriptional regulator [Candidatus Humimicrobiaceae bacterium]
MQRLTIKDISKIANVSMMTVSRVINNEKHVKKETKENVLDIIKQYGYEPNYFAQNIKTRKSNTIGLIIGDIENPFYSRLAKGVINVAETSNYNVIVCNSNYNPKLGEKYLNMLIKKGVDGILIATIDVSNDAINNLNKRNIPYVLVTRKSEEQNGNYFIADDYMGGRMASEYLIKLGHKKIFFLRSADVLGANERLRAFKDSMRENDIFFNETYISKILTNAEDAYSATIEFIEENQYKEFTALIGGNDFIAMGAMNAIIDKGLDIPKDLSLIGYDNLWVTKILKVALTTVRQPKMQFGQMSTERLLEMIKNPELKKYPQKIILKPDLVIRNSCRKLN